MGRKAKKKSDIVAKKPERMTLMQHFDELKNRLFWTAIAFVIGSAAAYPFFDQILAFIKAPIGDHELYYFSVVGGLSFVIKICMYAGMVAAIPALIFHLYKFIAPVMTRQRSRSIAVYTLASAVLAVGGIIFSYYVILPAALKFLTEFSMGQITNMLSIDSYVSFVVAYLMAGALLFQLPILLLSINNIHRLKPKKLFSYERHVIVGAFIFAAILSPTPDAINQAMMAAPIILMYQVGVICVWWTNRHKDKKAARQARKAERKQARAEAQQPTPLPLPEPSQPVLMHATQPAGSVLASTPMKFRTMDMRPPRVQPTKKNLTAAAQPAAAPLTKSMKKPAGLVSPAVAKQQSAQVRRQRPSVLPSTPVPPIRAAAASSAPLAVTATPRYTGRSAALRRVVATPASATARPQLRALQRQQPQNHVLAASQRVLHQSAQRPVHARRGIDGFGSVYQTT